MDKNKLAFEIRLAENRSNKFLRIVIRKYSEFLDKNPDDKAMKTALLAACIVLCSRYVPEIDVLVYSLQVESED